MSRAWADAARRRSGEFTAERSSGIFARKHRKVRWRGAALPQIAQWLEKLGMSEYARLFGEPLL